MTAAALAALLCVGVMGFAIQRGATCTVAAVDEVLTQRRAYRLAAMLEASLWVAGGLLLAGQAGLAGSMPAGYAAGTWTVVGAVLLGLGAWLNKACVFGAVARLGSGDWAYAATPVGFYAGCRSTMALFPAPASRPLSDPSPLFQAPSALAALFLIFVAWRLWPGLRAWRDPDRVRLWGGAVWAPHAATVVIGICFVITLLLAGRWAYTDVLADLARGMDLASLSWRLPLLLLAALYAGALVGGASAGRWTSSRVSAVQLARCFCGGAVMGWGSLLIPGSNDGLILIGLPLLQAHAWLAFACMFGTIAAAMRLTQRARSPAPGPTRSPPA